MVKTVLVLNFIRAICVSILLLPSLGSAELYYWIDEKGIKHYSNIENDTSADIIQLPESYSIVNNSAKSQRVEPKKKIETSIIREIPKPRVNVVFKYYEVLGVNLNDLRSETIKHSPIKHNGGTFRGSVQRYIKPYYEAKRQGEVWYLDRISVKVDFTITMPKWKDYQKANWNEQKRWDDYYNKLLKHELVHKDIGIEAAEKLCRVLAGLKTTNGKSFLLKLANDQAQVIYRECNRLNKQYDEKTDHGHKEGVILK